MRAIVLCGSRNANGQTAQAAKAVEKGLQEAGATTEMILLPPLDLQRCRQCDDSGWGLCLTEGRCVIADDFAGLVESIKRADAVVFATPVYYSDLSESLRAFTDRLRRICAQPAGRIAVNGKPAMGLCVAGGGGGGAPACCVNLEKVMAQSGFNVVDVIPVRRQNLPVKRQTLEQIGNWFASEAKSNSSRTLAP